MKKRGIDLLDELNNEFLEAIKEESQSKLDGPSTSERKDKGKSKESTSQAETLAKVINENWITEPSPRDCKTCREYAVMPSTDYPIALNMILQGNFNADGTLFDCNLLDLHGYGLFSKAPAMVEPDIDDSVSFYFTRECFYQLLCVCIGKISIEKHKTRILTELLLKIHLAPKRFFAQRKALKRAKKEKPKAKKRLNTKRLIDKLFWVLVKENSKSDIIQHWSDKLFSAVKANEAYTDDSVISGAVVNTGYNTDIDPKAKLDSNIDAGTDTCSKDEQDSQDEAEDQDEDEDENDKQEADLTSR
ncbi:hypothetical protein [Parasitella parasitica]|uniref:Uncharacterized protein n=1 Tax=Parasitella parasitica TaxID=35722 RepID=A0A0B7N348_9FUNG|nr:hypothetical protein [Parasitella parasitica]